MTDRDPSEMPSGVHDYSGLCANLRSDHEEWDSPLSLAAAEAIEALSAALENERAEKNEAALLLSLHMKRAEAAEDEWDRLDGNRKALEANIADLSGQLEFERESAMEYMAIDMRALEALDRAEYAEARLKGAVEVVESIYEIAVEPGETDDKSVRGWIEVQSRSFLSSLEGDKP